MAYHVGTCTHWISLIFYSKYTVTFATTYLKKKPSWLIHHTSLILEFARQATNKMPLQAPSCALWQPWGHIYLNIWNRLSSSAKGCWFEFGDCENRLHLDLDCFCMSQQKRTAWWPEARFQKHKQLIRIDVFAFGNPQTSKTSNIGEFSMCPVCPWE